ncbi:hypothetical protein Misp05_44620 [Micromonospora sp. NBRC 107095]|nr:hypothetical protein Misp05_44620 [Micromonospora sp. NBRC 107095]
MPTILTRDCRHGAVVSSSETPSNVFSPFAATRYVATGDQRPDGCPDVGIGRDDAHLGRRAEIDEAGARARPQAPEPQYGANTTQHNQHADNSAHQ